MCLNNEAINDFLNDYVALVIDQRIDQQTLPGVKPAPIIDAEEIVDATQAKRKADEDGQDLFAPRKKPGRPSTDQRRQEEQRTGDGAGRKRTGKSRKIEASDARQNLEEKTVIAKTPSLENTAVLLS